VIRSIKKPYHATGGLAVLLEFSPEGAVVKRSAVDDAMLRHKGPARVFNSEEEAIKVILNRKIKKGDVWSSDMKVQGGPGMREMLGPTSAIVGLEETVTLHYSQMVVFQAEAERCDWTHLP